MESRFPLQNLSACPGFNARAAHRRFDQPDRRLARLQKIPPKIIRGCRERLDAFRSAQLPLAFHVVRSLVRHRHPNPEQPHVRIIGLCYFVGRIGRGRHVETHIRLPGSQPDFAHQHVVNRDRITALHRHVHRSPDGQRLKHREPFAIRPGGDRNLFSAQHHRDSFARVGPAPNPYRDSLLQQHMVGDERRQAHRGAQRNRAQVHQEKSYCVLSHFDPQII